MSLAARPQARRRRLLGSLAVLVVLFCCALFLHSCSVQRTMRRQIAEAERDPITGVLRGAESVTLTPVAHRATSRTACLMVHGFLSTVQDFGGLGERLAEQGVTVRKMRLPGHGTTPVDLAYQPPGALYRAVEKEYRDLARNFDRIYVVGFSMGGALSTLLASREPVDRLVLLAPYYAVTYKWQYVLPPETWNAILGWIIPYVVRPEAFIKINDRSVIDSYPMYRILPTAGVRQLVALGREARREEVLRAVTCPILHVHSKGDEASSPKAAQRAFEKLGSQDKQQRWFTRANHVLLWDYDKKEVEEAAFKFLTGGS